MNIHSRSRVVLPTLVVVVGFLLCQAAGVAPAQAEPGAFGKAAPANFATGQPLSVTLSWGSSTGATSYEYCYDTINDNSCNTTWVSTGTSMSAVVGGLSPNTPYYWHVRAVDGGTTYSDGSATAFWRFTTGSLPGIFGKVAPANNATGQPLSVTLSWGGSTGATSYEYCYDTINDGSCNTAWISTGTSTSVVVGGLSANTAYYWHVRAVNPLGMTYSGGGESDFWKFTTSAPPGAFGKAAPANNATSQPLNATLSWGSSTGATSYEYCIDTVDDAICNTAWASTGASTSATMPVLSANTAYYWHVRAANSVGTTYSDGGTAAFWKFTTGSSLAPGAFGKAAPANNATNQPLSVTLSWGSSAAATAYEYCYDTINDGSCNTAWISTGTSRSAVVAGLSANTAYYWHVRAVNSVGTAYSDGSTAAFWKFTTSAPPGAFGKAAPANNATNQPLNVTLSWGSSTGATSYEYCIDTINDNACNTAWASTGASTSVMMPVLSANTAYYWHVRAVNSGGTTYSDGSTTAYWRFTTGSLPGAFGKVAPVNYATGQPLSVTLSWGTSVMSPAGSYQYCYDTTNDNACGSWASTTSTSVAIAGLSANTTYYWHVRAINSSGTTYSDGSAYVYWRFTTGAGTPGTMLFRSLGVYDGWVRESGETSGVGGAVNSTMTTCRVGDDLADRQYRSVLDFKTSRLPDNAIITKVVLKFKPATVAGTNPFLTHGNLAVDIRFGAFDNSLALWAADFQAPASRTGVGVFRSTPLANGQYRAIIGAGGYASVNLRGHTQFRLAFTVEDNDDRGADYLAFLCGNTALLRDRPVLVVTYRLP
jgi:hypothetical protein